MNIVQEYAPRALVFLLAITFHEFAHAWSAYRFGDDTAHREGRVTFNPIVHLDLWGTLSFVLTGFRFGWAKPVPVNPTNFGHPRRDDILVSLAGPLSNILLATLFGLVLRFVSLGQLLGLPLGKFLVTFLIWSVLINLFLAFFNLIPLFPLDGSHVVTSLLPLNQAYRFKRFNEAYGPMLLLGLIAVGWFSRGLFDPLQWLIVYPSRFLSLLITGKDFFS